MQMEQLLVERPFADRVREVRRQPRLRIGERKVRREVLQPADVAALWPELPTAEREVFGVVMLDARHFSTRRIIVSVGSMNASIVHPREVFRNAILYSAAAIVVTHNHPSGDPEPSDEDRTITRRLVNAGEMVGIPILDHVVIARRGIYSFRAHDIL
jgi:DNA repair protein RadC